MEYNLLLPIQSPPITRHDSDTLISVRYIRSFDTLRELPGARKGSVSRRCGKIMIAALLQRLATRDEIGDTVTNMSN